MARADRRQVTGGDVMVGLRQASPEQAVRERANLLSTKLTVPRVRFDRLTRSRLIDVLNAAAARELVLVCTPAGFGKTTLLADWATAARWPIAWLSLDPDDNDPVRFWRYVAAALDRVCSGLGDRLLPQLEGPGPWPTSSQGIVAALINDIETHADELVLVLDDYHVVESPPIHDGLTFLLSRMPRQLHLVVASRSDPPLPLARLRARDQVTELRATDLRFTSSESAALLRQVWQLDLSPQVLAALERKTEGWAVGLQLAALSLRERTDPDSLLNGFTGSHRYVLDYLSEEVIERQPERVRMFLLSSSILDRMTGPLCDTVTGGADGQEMLEDLERANLFLIPLDDQRRWYRFHHLFADVLRARLKRVDASGVPDLHRRAAQWYERQGLIDDAIRHAATAGDHPWAARLVEQHLSETLRRGETALLARWIDLLPDDVVRSRPGLLVAQAMQALHAGHLDVVEQCVEYADGALGREQQGRQKLRFPTDGGMVSEVAAAVALLRAELATVRGDVERMAAFARQGLEHMADDERGPRIWARLLLASGDWMSGRLADAESAFAEVLADARAAPEATPMMATCFPLGRVRHARGNLEGALRTYEDGLRFAAAGGALPSLYHAAESHLGMGQVFYERNELDSAMHQVSTGIDLGRQVVDLTTPLLGFVTLAWIHQARGDPDAALAAMDEACELRSSPDVIAMWNPAPSERARLLLLQGRIDQATWWTEERGLGPDDPVGYPREREHLVLARVLVAHGAPDRALRLLERLDRLAESQGRVQSLIQIRTVRALALQAAGDHQGALTVLAEALSLAQPAGFVRVFADEGLRLATLLRSLVSVHQEARVLSSPAGLRQHVSRILHAFDAATPTAERPGPVVGLIEDLTRREIEVLRLIADGRHNREIAQELFVTVDTVKKHASHILSKLGATSRTHAVARARDLGLIP